MKKIMLDHYRRWWLVLVLVGALEFLLGWAIVTSPATPFEFWAFLLALWTGATLLSFDLKRGILRALGALPLTGRDIGRSWWLATVAIPAVALAALLFSGAATFYHFHPDRVFLAERLTMACLFNVAWLGISFTMTFNATRGMGGNFREFAANATVSWLAMLAFFGSMLLCQDASKSPLKATLLLGLGAALTVVGWLRAEQFELGRASLHPGRIEPPNLRRTGARLTPLSSRIVSHVPGGYGGIAFLIRTTFVRAFTQLALMAALMAILWRWQEQRLPQPKEMSTVFVAVGSFMACWFMIFYQLLPGLRQLRMLRTLPVSANRLAATLIAVAILPLLALGALVSGVAGLTLGAPAAHTVLSSFTFILAPTALCVFFVVWRGAGKQAYVWLILTLFGYWLVGSVWLQTAFHYREIPFNLAGLIAGISILLAFLLTRHALTHSRHAYLGQPNPVQ